VCADGPPSVRRRSTVGTTVLQYCTILQCRVTRALHVRFENTPALGTRNEYILFLIPASGTFYGSKISADFALPSLAPPLGTGTALALHHFPHGSPTAALPFSHFRKMAQQPDDPTCTASGSHQQQLLTPSEWIQSVALLRKLHIVHSNDSDDVGDEESDEKRVEYCASVVRLVLAQGRRLEGIAGEVKQFATAFHSLAEPLAASALSPQQTSNWPHVSAASESPSECDAAGCSGIAFGGCATGSAGELPNSAASFDECHFSGEACAPQNNGIHICPTLRYEFYLRGLV
jgi:hypothetical protein